MENLVMEQTMEPDDTPTDNLVCPLCNEESEGPTPFGHYCPKCPETSVTRHAAAVKAAETAQARAEWANLGRPGTFKTYLQRTQEEDMRTQGIMPMTGTGNQIHSSSSNSTSSTSEEEDVHTGLEPSPLRVTEKQQRGQQREQRQHRSYACRAPEARSWQQKMQ